MIWTRRDVARDQKKITELTVHLLVPTAADDVEHTYIQLSQHMLDAMRAVNDQKAPSNSKPTCN